jgi:hypothetical protein
MISNKKKSDIAASRLRAWISEKPAIPMYHGRVNRSKICRILGLPVSTIRTNKALAEIFNQLSVKCEPLPSKASKEIQHQAEMAALFNKISEQQTEIIELRRRISSIDFLVFSGILLP